MNRGAPELAIDWKTEVRRPVPVALGIVALIGWIVAISFIVTEATLRASAKAQIQRIEASRQQLAADLDQQHKAAGTLADLQARAEAMRAELAPVQID